MMSNSKKSSKDIIEIDEEEIFKSLNHKLRRDIIRSIGHKSELTFTGIKNRIYSIDSPTLSYHLKSLQALLNYKENKYKLSEIGISAYNLLLKIDQSHKISKYRRRFLFVYIFTVICWSVVQTLVPLIIFTLDPLYGGSEYFYIIQITLSIVAAINYIIVWILKKD